MYIVNAPVNEVRKIQPGIFLLKAHCPEITKEIKPGQFCNIKVSTTTSPLLRRPFSVCDIEGEYIFFMFNVHGEGTELLSKKEHGELIDVLGPLGNGFDLDGDYDTAVIAAGGLGAAPFPFFTRMLPKNKNVLSFMGGRSKSDIITYGLKNVQAATDDGSFGFKGTIIDLMNEKIDVLKKDKIKIFSCGPNPMLKALKDFCDKHSFEALASTECAMACGFGICQGCPIESSEDDKYYLVCKDGPVFDIKDIKL
ncbi:MAG: dihydroorotate dehydrogenase electron transfer subunit [Ignavibacteriae bacterium]|nr:dihydroorotate dehydrogenase electron transfer subunit [Ignavibacteriota bacterium]NOG98199.1 dihydroorotate dehydrogenase electron transfer subunit [Ignavibacteriota bacterium]